MISGLLLLLSLRFSSALHFLFLTHINELQRVTNTAGICQLNLPADQTTKLVWSGRACNKRLEERINEIKEHSAACYLLFTDKWSNSMALSSLSSSSSPSRSTLYIILDSTWTEARQLYRKGPLILRNTPLLSIDGDKGKGSIYSLRRDFGYVSKFSKNFQKIL